MLLSRCPAELVRLGPSVAGYRVLKQGLQRRDHSKVISKTEPDLGLSTDG
jgi:hypothetical protein